MRANIFEPDWDAQQDRPPFTWRRARIGRQAGSGKLGASLFEMPPGASSFPLHVHHANEEMILVLAGCDEYPDSGKVWMRSFPPGAAAGDDDPGLDVLIHRGEQLDYLHGES